MKPLVVALALVSLVGCSKAYSDLENAFGVETLSTKVALETRDIMISSQRHPGIAGYRGVARVFLQDDSIGIKLLIPFSTPLSIPAYEVGACGMTCFGTDDQHVDLLIPRTGSKVIIPSSGALLDWCWKHKKPMLPTAAESDWLYKRVPLPQVTDFQAQLASRAVFDDQVTQSCLGY